MSNREPHPRPEVEAAISEWEQKAAERREKEQRIKEALARDQAEGIRLRVAAAAEAVAFVKADAFFGPLFEFYYGVSDYDGESEDTIDLKCELVWDHAATLAGICRGLYYGKLEFVTAALEMDESACAFTVRLIEHFSEGCDAEGHEFVRGMFTGAWDDPDKIAEISRRLLEHLELDGAEAIAA